MNSSYTIPTIPQNLGKQETIVQIVEVLDHLNAITQDIFSKVNKRIKENSDKLTNISKRVETAASKVEQLKGDKKAKTVFSSSKYPATDVNRDYVSIFKDSSEIKLNRHEVKHTKYVSTYEPLTKLQFYHVKLPEQKNDIISEGLGDIPSDIKCVNDLLLFNSGKNMYTDFSLTHSLKATKPVRVSEYNTASELGAAPNSISQRSSLQQTNKENYFYTPKAEELPALDVPLDLPDLPGIADDLRFELEFGASIGPSATNQNVLLADVTLDLPSVVEIKASPGVVPPPPPPPPPPIEAIPEPPVMALPTMSSDKVSLSSGSMVISETTVDAGPSHIPKPPSPPPIAPLPPPTALPPITALPPQIDSRASLMDAIRKAGGAQNLKKTNVPKTPTSKSGPSGGDLMADLHSKLMMRRKGISGAKNAEQGNAEVTPGSTLARMSSMIPPPASKSDVESGVSTDEEEEWND